MKRFIFLAVLLCVVVGLTAGVTRVTAEKDRPGQAKYPTRDVFYTEDFETGATGWTHYDGAVTPNNWHIYAGDGYATAPCWWMGEDPGIGGYYDHQYLVLDTDVIPISTGNSTLSFAMKHGLEEPGASGDYDGWDSFNIRISLNSGVSWEVIPTTVLSVPYDFANSYAFGSEFGEGLGIPGWGGQRAWTTVTADLSSYLVSGAANVKIRFAFAADPAYSTADDPTLFGVMVDTVTLAGYSNNGVATGMTFASLVPTAGDFWHVATDATAPSPTHTMSSMNSAGTYVPFMLNYLVSPEITLPADATQIAADFQMKGSYYDAGVFPDVDYFGWEIFYGGAWHYMSNPYDDPDGSNYVYSGAPDTWASMIASYTLDGDISLLAGQTVKFAWYFQSNGNTPIGTPLQIDDFQIFSVSAAPAPPNLVYPLNNQANLPYTGFDFDWTVSSLGAFPDYYTIYVDADLANLEPATFSPTFSLEIQPVLNPADSLYYLSSTCYSGDIPDFQMLAGQTWYWTVVASIADQPDAFSEIWRFDTVPASSVINTFPWLENFEHTGAMPTGWTVGDVDNDAVTWAPYSSTTYSHSPTYSMRHLYSDLVPDPGQNGWLVSPPIQLPAEGVGVLTFWSYNQYPAYAVHNGVWINTDPNPLDPYWVNVWEQDDFTTQAWVQETIDVSAYNGNIIYVAFKYTGFDANAWYVDDVGLAFYTSDVLAPVLSGHLPVLNTPREDLTWPVAVNVQDDAVFNNPITAVNMYWSLDGGSTWSAAIPLTLTTGTTYEGTLPAQPLGSTVTYKFEAFDSIGNMGTATYTYEVADPVWIWYDTGGTGYTGFASYNWGPAVYFENPFYGTDTSVQLLGSDGALHNATAGNGPTVANMNVYGEDFEGNLTPLMPTLPVTFTHRTYRTVDLSALNIQITTPWFWISYEDLGTNRYFLYDATYNYTDPLFLFIGGDLYTSTSTGEWCIGAYVQTGGPALYYAPEPTIALTAGVPTVSWPALSGALSYDVYGTNDPYAADPWALLSDNQVGTSYQYTGTAAMQFFKIVASTNAAGGKSARATHSQPLSVTPEVIKADLGLIRK